MRFRRQAAWTAINADAFEIAGWVRARARNHLGIEFQIVGNEEIQIPVAVDVDEGASRAPPRALVQQARLLGHIRKRAVAVVAVKNIPRPAGDKDILEAIVVVVADRDAAV